MNNSSLMSRTAATLPSANNGKLLSQLRDALAPSVSSLSLEDRLTRLTREQRQQVLTFAQLAKMMAVTEIALKGHSTQSYLDIVRKVYRGGDLMMQQLIADVLEEVAPIEVIQAEPQPETDARMSFYMRDDFKLPSAVEDATEALTPETGPEQLSFLDLLEQSESSGRSDAEITIGDGRRFVGSLQFSKARLSDYQKATGTRFTQDEFIADKALQEEVAAWHIADIDDVIDALGDAAASYDRDGLRAVAHLGGKSGMKKFVQSKGEYNPADELGTSLQSYYDKFAQRGDASCSIERFRYQRTTITTPAFGRAIAVGFASNAARMTYSGSYKHTGRLSGAVSAIIRNGGQYICVMQEQNHLLRCQ